MTQICGWFDSRPERTEQRRPGLDSRFADRLPDSSSRLHHRVGSLYCDSPGASSYSDIETNTAVAISGRPRWRNTELKKIADAEDNATALAYGYRTLGIDVVNELAGAFAFAVADGQRARLCLAVDRMGIIPMFLGQSDDGTVTFGTRLPPVFANDSLPRTVSDTSLYRFFYFHVVPSPATIFEHVEKLEPAQLVTIEDNKVQKEIYWTPKSSQRTRAREETEILLELREQTRDAVHRCSHGAQTGAFLSGGLDSSTVSGLANEMTDEPLRVLTIGFDQQGFDEMEFARAAARHFGLEHIEYYITPDDVAGAFDLLSTAYDEPFGNSSAIPAYFCARKARECGVTRLLAGDGGDELFGGNERYGTQRLFGIYDRMPGFVRKGLLNPLAAVLPDERPVVLRKIRRYIEQARIPMPDRLQTYNFLELFDPQSVFDSSFLSRVDTEAPRNEMRSWYERSDGSGLLDRMLFFDWKLTLADNDIRKVNRMCSTAGVDVEYPLLDDDLVEFSLTMPENMKLRGSDLRYGFRKAFEDYLPVEVLNKDKHGFGLPFGEWLKSSPPLRDKIRPLVSAFADRNILSPDFIAEMEHKHETEHATYFGNMLWLIAVLENWLRKNAA